MTAQGLHYLEALLDPASEEALRSDWQALSRAGLPSQGDHRGDSNRPHVTWTVVAGWPEQVEGGAVTGLPLRVALGPLAVFARAQRLTLVRTLVVTEALLAVRRAVVGRVGPPARPFYAADRWVPHLTLAGRLTGDQTAAALALLRQRDAHDEVTLIGVRRWDAAARQVRDFPDGPLTPRTGSGPAPLHREPEAPPRLPRG